MGHYKLREVAEILGIKVRTVREWVHNGKLKAHKLPGHRYWIVEETEIRRLQNGNNS